MFHRKAEGKSISAREVVIVCVLLLLLGFVAVPFYFRQQSDALRIAGANNLQQWGIALNLYLIENGSRLPQTGMPLEGSVNHFAWYNALPLYISQKPYSEIEPVDRPLPGKPSIWMDPSVTKAEGVAPGDPFFSYAMNRWLQPKLEEPSYKIFDLADASSVVFLTEASSPVPAITSPEAKLRFLTQDKKKAAHVLFCDGHVELVGENDLVEAPGSNDSQQPMGKVNWVPFYQAPKPQ